MEGPGAGGPGEPLAFCFFFCPAKEGTGLKCVCMGGRLGELGEPRK